MTTSPESTALLHRLRLTIDVLAYQLDDAVRAATDAADTCRHHGEHPAIVAGAYRVRDHLSHALGMVGAASGHLGSVRSARQVAAGGPRLPTEDERTGGAYLARGGTAELQARYAAAAATGGGPILLDARL